MCPVAPSIFTTRALRMQAVLTEALVPSYIMLHDESAKHRGHAGLRYMGTNVDFPSETHFVLKITSAALTGLSRIAQHQKIYAILAHEFETGLHALQINVIKPNNVDHT